MHSHTLALFGLLLVPALGLTTFPAAPALQPKPPLVDAERHLLWSAEMPTPAPAWPDQARIPFDRAPRPLLVGARVYHGCTRTDSVIARDRATGEEKWRTTTGGPVRLPLAHWDDLIFAASDDGYLYALDEDDGAVRWKVRGGPGDRKLLGNERLISAWPARGGPVVVREKDDRATVYFAAGIWPFMGVFLHALDADTGTIRWTNDGEGARYMKQPHNSDSFAGVAPQGALCVAGDILLVPGGRSVPAAFNRHTGDYVHFRLADFGKVGGSEVQAAGNVYACGDAIFETATGTQLLRVGDPCLVADDRLYAWEKGQLTEFDLADSPVKREEVTDSKGKVSTKVKWEPRRLQSVALPAPGPLALLRHGDRLFVALADRVLALPVPLQRGKPIAWEAPIPGTPLALAAEGDDLVVATRQGKLLCYGFADQGAAGENPLRTLRAPASPAAERVRPLLSTTGQRAGYALVVGEAEVARALVQQSSLNVVLTLADAQEVAAVRRQAHGAGVFGDRLTVLHGLPETLELPPYFASLVVLDEPTAFAQVVQAGKLDHVFACVRPYGGVLVAPSGAKLAGAQPNLPVREASGRTLLTRAGPLPGAGNWTHENADAANSRLSHDTLVKAPLGMLWFGGPSNDGVLPRHGHGPQPQVVDGRAIIEGVNQLRATDIYTGRLLWETKLPGVGKLYDNLAHQPGANACGSNFVSLSDAIYVAVGKECVRLDPATGKKVASYHLPNFPKAGATTVWSYLNVTGDYLIGGTQQDNPTKATKQVAPSASKLLFVLHRQTGKLLWSATARNDGWRHNGICAGGGKLFAIDRPQSPALWGGKIDKPKGTARLVAFDLASGNETWSSINDVFGTWLAYSEEHDILVEAGRQARDSLLDEPKGMRAYQGTNGRALWHNADFAGPTMLRSDHVLFGANNTGKMCALQTGAVIKRPDPVTGEMVEWTWARHYGCNTPMASEHLITFRSGAAGFYDLCNAGGTGNLGGFRSGCTNNLVVAGGLLVVPDYTRTCTCSYQNQCSVALIPMPEADLWTFQGGASDIKGTVRRLGVLLGGPGNRKADTGTLWLEYPSVGSPGPKPQLTIAPTPTYFRRHFSQVEGNPAWVGASGAVGLEKLTLTVGPKGAARPYTVRLYFVEPDEKHGVGERVFDVALNGKTVLSNFDVRADAGDALKLVAKEFAGVALSDKLEIQFTASAGVPVLSGVEVVRE